MKETKPIIVEKDGEIIATFLSIKDAVLLTGMNDHTIRYRIDKASEVKGLIFRYGTPKAVKAFKELNPPKKNKLKALEADHCNIEAASKKYTVIPYELKAGRICVTPCPYKDSPKPRVGSGECLACTSFHGRNRFTQQVACSAVGKYWKNLAET